MSTIKFATYLHPQTCLTSKSVDNVKFIGQSYNYFCTVREKLSKAMAEYNSLAVRKVEFQEFSAVHSAEYLMQLTTMAAEQPLTVYPKLSIECKSLEYLLPGYEYGLGGMYEAIDQMKAGKLERVYCFSPPGHHAYSDWGHGYCILNPLAVAAKYAQRCGFENVLIVDWDHHHGDGTQTIFNKNSSVYCISIHDMMDLYMAFQRVWEIGTTTKAKEMGHYNIPILNQSFNDVSVRKLDLSGKYYRGTESKIVFRKALENLPWTPDIIFIFSGYDSHKDDCGKDVSDWDNKDFKILTRYVLDTAKKNHCPVLSVHGGGYKLNTTISAAISHVEELANYNQ